MQFATVTLYLRRQNRETITIEFNTYEKTVHSAPGPCRSPSGDGLKWIIPIDLAEYTHGDYFQAVAAYILQRYSVQIDKSGRDVSRACFLPYDPNAFINPELLKQHGN